MKNIKIIKIYIFCLLVWKFVFGSPQSGNYVILSIFVFSLFKRIIIIHKIIYIISSSHGSEQILRTLVLGSRTFWEENVSKT